MRLNHNLASLNIYREHIKTLVGQSASSERISTGNKINGAKDNPNGLAQSERFRIQIRGLQMAQKNTQDGISMLQTAQGGINSITSALQRVKELSIQAGGANTLEDKGVIQDEIKQLISGLNDTANNTEFNGIKLIGDNTVASNGSPKILNMATGANVGDSVEMPVFDLSSDKLGKNVVGGKLDDIDVTAAGGVDAAVSIIDAALNTVLSVGSNYGALEGRFESSYDMNDAINFNMESAESNIRDADIAEEMMAYAKYNVLMEAGNAMMVQSNKFPQDILRILENVK
jgi:flagellin